MKKKRLNEYFNFLIKLAMSMVASILVFFSLALYLDRLFFNNGALVIAGTFIGVLVGFWLIYKQLKGFFE